MVPLAGFILWSLTACEGEQRKFLTESPRLGPPTTGYAPDANAGLAESLPGSTVLAGSSGSGGLQYDPARLELGAVEVGFPAFGRVRLQNRGSEPAETPAVSMLAGSSPDFVIAQNHCDRALAPRATCDVRIQLIPSTIGQIEARLELELPSAGVTVVPLAAQGVPAGDLVVRPVDNGSVDFGEVLVGASSEARFRVTNPVAVSSGSLSVSLGNPEFAVAPPMPGDCQVRGASLAGGQTCELWLIYTPSSRGPQEATLTISSTELGSRSLGLLGRGLIPGALTVTPEAQDFRGVVLGGAAVATLSLQNEGDLPITLSGIAFRDGLPEGFAISSAQCGAGDTLQGGDVPGACGIEIEFRPDATAVVHAELSVNGDPAAETRVPITGRGLLPGTLTVSAVGGSSDFGDVLLGRSRTLAFEVSNSGVDSSGTLTIEASGDFEVISGAAPGDCQLAGTILDGAESCVVNVALSPTLRAARNGTLSIESQLAGAASIGLTGRGILPGQIRTVQEELNFGHVLRGRASHGVISIVNDGDLPVAPPTLAIANLGRGRPTDFSWTSACLAPLEPGTECEIALTLLPSVEGHYSGRFELSSHDVGTRSVLVLAESIEPGSLVLEAASGGSSDFGDVPVNVAVHRTFTLTNPGGEPSGSLSISTNDHRFVVEAGSCGDVLGISSNESCSFDVVFTPDSSQRVTANVMVESSSAGNATLSLSGRGRNPATLAGSNEFNFGTVVLTQSAAPRRWTVTNSGDLATGQLAVRGGSQEFSIHDDTCSNRTLAAGTSCSLDVTFSPQGAGIRQTQIQVFDTSPGGSVSTLSVGGVGQPLPAIGEPCLEGRCAAGATCENHSNGLSQVCCGADCAGNQRCSEGQNFQACELPTVGPGARCVAGTNVCAAGLTCDDPVRPGFCCPSGCTGPCQVCSAQGTCDTLPDQQKGACGGNKVCVRGACSCSGINRESLDCGGDRCIRDVLDACCDNNGCRGDDVCGANNLCGCPAGTRECNPGSNACVPSNQCCNCGGPCQRCTSGICGTVPDGEPGTCGAGEQCRQGNCVPALAPAALATTVNPAPIPQTVIGSTSSPVRWIIINNGGQATQPLTLVRNFNANEFIVESNCLGLPLAPGNTCVLTITFAPQSPAGSRSLTLTVAAGPLTVSTSFAPIQARVGPGGDCTLGATAECAPGLFCQVWYLDQDLDGWGGEPRFGGAPTRTACSNQPDIGAPPAVIAMDRRGGEVAMPYVPGTLSGDCCDYPGLFQGSTISLTPFDVNPGISTTDIRPASDCLEPNDLNCDGEATCTSVPAGDGDVCL